jgi:hypothetical protein
MSMIHLRQNQSRNQSPRPRGTTMTDRQRRNLRSRRIREISTSVSLLRSHCIFSPIYPIIHFTLPLVVSFTPYCTTIIQILVYSAHKLLNGPLWSPRSVPDAGAKSLPICAVRTGGMAATFTSGWAGRLRVPERPRLAPGALAEAMDLLTRTLRS